MLSKLIKYDLKFFYKWLSVLYLITFIFALVAAITTNFTHIFILKIVHDFSVTATFGLAFGTLLNACMRIWVKYNYSLYGDEAYLTHTLPIRRRTIWTAKFISSLIIVAISLLFFLLCFVVVAFSAPNTDLSAIFEYSEFWPLFFTAIGTIFIQTCFIIQCGFIGITLSHHFLAYRGLLALIFGFLIYSVCEAVMVGIMLIWAYFNPSIQDLLLGGVLENNLSALTTLLYGIVALYILCLTGAYFANLKLLQRGINVD